jgi:hypothetical protein
MTGKRPDIPGLSAVAIKSWTRLWRTLLWGLRLTARLRLKGLCEASARFVGGFAPSLKELIGLFCVEEVIPLHKEVL